MEHIGLLLIGMGVLSIISCYYFYQAGICTGIIREMEREQKIKENALIQIPESILYQTGYDTGYNDGMHIGRELAQTEHEALIYRAEGELNMKLIPVLETNLNTDWTGFN